jgi:DNA-binding transcriptional LysR family regulator
MRGTQFAELSAFVTVAEQKSFTKAGKQLGLSTATLSQAIKNLEDRLGIRLLNRTTRSVGVTAVGERLLARLRPVLDDYEAALESINDFRDRPCGLLRLTVAPPAAEFIIAPMLPRFLAQYPEIQVEISVDGALRDIVAERFDAGIRPGHRVERDMIAVKLSDVTLSVVASPGYLARMDTPEKPEDLSTHRCIRLRFPSGEIAPWRFRRRGKSYDVTVDGPVVNEEHLVRHLAAAGTGIAYTPEAYVAPLIHDGMLVSMLRDCLPPPIGLYLYYPSRRQNPAALQALVDFLKAETKRRVA